MKTHLVAMLVALAMPLAGQTGSLPRLASSPEQFVPPGWTLEKKHLADLNGDGLQDALLLMKAPQTGGTPPRILAVALRRKGPATEFELAELNEKLIPNSPDDRMEDPMADGEITPKRGAFSVKLSLLAGAGSARTATMRYGFRYQNGCFRLIGYDRFETDRATLDTLDLSINFLTGDVVRRKGNAEANTATKQREKLRTNPRRCFRDLNSAATFTPQI